AGFTDVVAVLVLAVVEVDVVVVEVWARATESAPPPTTRTATSAKAARFNWGVNMCQSLRNRPALERWPSLNSLGRKCEKPTAILSRIGEHRKGPSPSPSPVRGRGDSWRERALFGQRLMRAWVIRSAGR